MKKQAAIVLISGFSVVAAAAWALADDKGKSHAKDSPANAAFEKMKGLAGKWVAAESDDAEMKDAHTTYRVTAGGSAVIETIMPGSDHEMITMYHMDGDKVVMTHYCVLGNQPHMTSKGLVGNKIEFVCDGHGGNMKSENDMHMHSATFTFTDDDHLKTVWESYKDGKPAGHTGTFNLTRKK